MSDDHWLMLGAWTIVVLGLAYSALRSIELSLHPPAIIQMRSALRICGI